MNADNTKREVETREPHTSSDGSRRREEADSLQHAFHPPPHVVGYEVSPRGRVFYDGECRFCVHGATRWGSLFARRGFAWLPLQTPGTTTRLGLDENALREEMKLLDAEGRIVGGVDAWAVLFRSVWWLWPVGVLLGLPGARWVGGVIYHWVARNRHCLSGSCELPNHQPGDQKQNDPRHRAFFEIP
jgi:predicted DCC family thiol-disulfide oxidoreductase YuxK